MESLQRLQHLAIFLVLLLISNSSLALKTVSHSSHQHDNPDIAKVIYETPGDYLDVSHFDPADNHLKAPLPFSDDCACNDVCCFSSFELGTTLAKIQPVFSTTFEPWFSEQYTSVSIDLLLPPPLF